MSSLIARSLSIYQNQGAKTLLKRAFKKARRDAYYRTMSIRGECSLTLEGWTVRFSAPSVAMVERNHERFNSEKEELADFLDEIRADDVVYDIGANTGLYSLFAANECPDGNVIAFEPYPPNLDLLKQDISRNGFEHIEVIEMALSNSVGTIGFSQPKESDIGYGSSAIGPGDNKDTIEVPTTTGDQLIDDGEIPPPNVVKIDVEGAEPLVIDGLERALSAPSCRVVYCEVHLPGNERRPSVEDFDSSATDIRNRFEEFGFTAEKLPRGDRAELFYKFSK